MAAVGGRASTGQFKSGGVELVQGEPATCARLARWLLGGLLLISSGCAFFPDVRRKPQHINPFPQLQRVAVVPFRNQSQQPSLSGARVSDAYQAALQSIRGFEVLPSGLVANQLTYFESEVLQRPISTAEDFQQLAELLGVDAVLVGAITDYDPYYPPRMSLMVNWYAANPGFHPVPVGYALPWGTAQEKRIPSWVRWEAERELAREQLKGQTPQPASVVGSGRHVEAVDETHLESERGQWPDSRVASAAAEDSEMSTLRMAQWCEESGSWEAVCVAESLAEMGLPATWPTPAGFVPPGPAPNRPAYRPQSEPIISYIRSFDGCDEDFTEALADYYYFRDDGRMGGWQAYLQRSEDFIRFCCHLHLVETLAARGGEVESRLIFRWPSSRYQR